MKKIENIKKEILKTVNNLYTTILPKKQYTKLTNKNKIGYENLNENR